MNGPTLARFVGQAAIWGSSFTLIKFALDDLSPSQLVLVRLILGALVLGAIALLTRISLRMTARAWLHVGVSAVFANVIPYLLLSFGELHASAGLAGVLVGSTPLVTLLLAAIALREDRLTARSIAGFLAGFVGVGLVVAPWSQGSSSLSGAIACFLAAVSYGAGYVYVRRFVTPFRLQPLTLATNQLVAAFAVMLAITPAFGWQPVNGVAGSTLIAVLVLGLLSTGFANILYFRLIQDVGAATASAVDYLVPVFAVLFGALLVAEAITWNVIVGGVVVLAGMGTAEGRVRKRPTPTADAAAAVASATGESPP